MSIDVLIPAYNNPELLSRAVRSVFLQEYRPIRILINDDNSPIDLKSVVIDLENNAPLGISISYNRNSENLRPYWNILELYANVASEFFVLLSHDDYFIDQNFFSHAVRIMKSSGEKVFLANAQLEGKVKLMMQTYFQEPLRIDGDGFILGELWSTAHPSLSSIIYSRSVLDPYLKFLTHQRAVCCGKGLEPDEGLQLFMLGVVGTTFHISGRVVSVRGNPPDSHSKSKYWKDNWKENLFISYFKLLQYAVYSDNKTLINAAIFLLTSRFRYEGPFERVRDYFGDTELLRRVISKNSAK